MRAASIIFFILLIFSSLILLVMKLESCKQNNTSTTMHLPESDIRMKNGLLLKDGNAFSGQLFVYDEQGCRKRVCTYFLGRKHGTEFSYSPGNTLCSRRQFANGLPTGLQTGWWPNGVMRYRYEYNAEGQMHGTALDWSPTGQLIESFRYANGKEDGLQQMWYADGSLKANYEARNGRKYGLTGLMDCVRAEIK